MASSIVRLERVVLRSAGALSRGFAAAAVVANPPHPSSLVDPTPSYSPPDVLIEDAAKLGGFTRAVT